ncbi:PIN2/TERF1-interacting telomerase inhibitor 1 [Platysternon megacephalum]|uniref:PIN2/TERF1-interacting telomerase inhibitor 1 n=1 Tax=Platysternon megacephalum TaxID=55544 RepID=A0A4D9DQE5_9SAUR|nr:PIN2/TERF1-interacting telomerase inhibitor 1 [Platysternon megacephalum]
MLFIFRAIVCRPFVAQELAFVPVPLQGFFMASDQKILLLFPLRPVENGPSAAPVGTGPSAALTPLSRGQRPPSRSQSSGRRISQEGKSRTLESPRSETLAVHCWALRVRPNGQPGLRAISTKQLIAPPGGHTRQG